MEEVIDVYGCGEMVIDPNAKLEIDVSDEYEEIVISTEGDVIAFDEATGFWVRLGFQGV